MSYNEYRLKQYIKKTKETVSDEKDGFVRRKFRNLFYRLYPAQSLFNKNVADSLDEIMEYIETNTNASAVQQDAAAKQIHDLHETQIEELQTKIMQLQQEIAELKEAQRADKQ